MLDVFERLRYIKSFIQMMYPKITHKEIKISIHKIVKYQNKEKGSLTEQEEVILDLLIQHGIKPSTAHTWYKVLNLPDYLQQQIRDKRLSMTEAFKKNLEANRPKQVLAKEIRQDIISYVNQLAENDFLKGGEYERK